MSTVELWNEALRLPDEMRADFARQLAISLDPANTTLESGWLAEIEARLAAYDRGETKASPWRDVMERLRQVEAEATRDAPHAA